MAVFTSGELAIPRPMRRAARADSSAAWPLVRTGEALLVLGDLNGAAAAFDAALGRRPGFVRARFGVARARFAAGHLDEALGALAEVLATDPDHLAAHDLTARGLLGAGRGDEAVGHLRRVLEMDPGRGPARALLDSLDRL